MDEYDEAYYGTSSDTGKSSEEEDSESDREEDFDRPQV